MLLCWILLFITRGYWIVTIRDIWVVIIRYMWCYHTGCLDTYHISVIVIIRGYVGGYHGGNMDRVIQEYVIVIIQEYVCSSHTGICGSYQVGICKCL